MTRRVLEGLRGVLLLGGWSKYHSWMNILLVRLSSMGDVIHTLPAFRALRDSFPEATLGWAVEDSHSELLSGLPGLDHLYIVSRKRMKNGWKSRLDLAREMRGLMREADWDLAIDFQGLWKSLWVARWSGAKRIAGYAPSPEKTHWFYSDRVRLPSMDRHAVDRNLDLIASLGASVRHAETRSDFERDFSLPITPSHRMKASSLLAELQVENGAKRILLNFSARKPANRWGAEGFANLACALRERGYSPILTGAPGEEGEAEAVQPSLDNPIPSLVGKCSLLELAAVMEKAVALITGDTGPMHVAVSVGLPVVALFGPANPVRTGPYSPSAVVLQKPRECQPCYGRHCKFGQEPPPCMLDISVEEVVERVEEVLGLPSLPLELAQTNPLL